MSELRFPPIIELGTALGMFASVIKSGEPWTPTCQAQYDRANDAIKELYHELNRRAPVAAEPVVTEGLASMIARHGELTSEIAARVLGDQTVAVTVGAVTTAALQPAPKETK